MRIQIIDWFRGLACLAVVVHHVDIISRSRYGIDLTGGFLERFEFRLDFFFVLSGFIITWVYSSYLGRPEHAVTFLANRARRIYPLLFVLNTSKLLVLWLFSTGPWRGIQVEWSMVVSSYLALPSPHHPLILAAWTLPYLLVFYLTFAVGVATSRLFYTALICILLSVVTLANFSLLGEVTSHISLLSKPWFLQVMTGSVTALLLERWGKGFSGRAALWIGSSAFVYGLALFSTAATNWSFFTERIWWSFTFSMLIAGAVGYETNRRRPAQVNQVVSVLAKSSYSIYLVHSPVLVGVLFIANKSSMLDSTLTQHLSIGFAFLTAVFTGILCHYWIEQPLSRLFPATKS